MSQSVHIHLKILIRFSYLAESAFAKSKIGLEATREMLFDRDRLMRRFALFEALTLPSLKAQTQQQMDCVVLTSTDLPDWARQRLDNLSADMSNLQVATSSSRELYPAIKETFAAIPSPPGTTHIATMRTDDDDAMHIDTVRRVHEIAPHLVATDPGKPAVIAFNRGFYLWVNEDGPPDLLRLAARTPLGVGLTLVAPLDYPGNIYRRNHRALPQFYNCYSDGERQMFLRSIHGDNDSDNHRRSQGREVPVRRARRIIRENFGVDPDAVAALRC